VHCLPVQRRTLLRRRACHLDKSRTFGKPKMWFPMAQKRPSGIPGIERILICEQWSRTAY
jgi:hypothetical protein